MSAVAPIHEPPDPGEARKPDVRGEEDFVRFRRDLFMTLLALASIGMVVYVEWTDLSWSDPLFRQLAALDLAIVAVFLGEFLLRLRSAENRKRFLWENWYDLVGLVPLYADSISLLRGFRLLRVLRIARLFRAVHAVRRMKRAFAFVRRVLSASRLGYSAFITVSIVMAMGLVVWMLERDTNPDFAHLDDAFWWAIVTATTVGYGDITPQTGLARILAGGLMLLGIGLIGVVVSSLSTAVLTVAGAQEQEDVAAFNLAGQLDRLVQLHERGKLTDEEFSAAKAAILRSHAA